MRPYSLRVPGCNVVRVGATPVHHTDPRRLQDGTHDSTLVGRRKGMERFGLWSAAILAVLPLLFEGRDGRTVNHPVPVGVVNDGGSLDFRIDPTVSEGNAPEINVWILTENVLLVNVVGNAGNVKACEIIISQRGHPERS